MPDQPSTPADDSTQTVLATYGDYAHAQRAVDFLSDEKFAVEHLRIIGTDLRMVETVTGRLNWARAAFGSALAGMWFGLFIMLLIGLFANGSTQWIRLVFAGVFYGGLFGLIFGIVSYAITGGRRDFTSASQIVATAYEVTCTSTRADEAAVILNRLASQS